MKMLDKKRPHGTIYGKFDRLPNAKYTQDGHFFNAKGVLIEEATHPNKGIQSDPQGQTQDQDVEAPTNEAPECSIEEEAPLETQCTLKMTKTDEELLALAASGMNALREYADQFNIKGVAKAEIISELQALR